MVVDSTEPSVESARISFAQYKCLTAVSSCVGLHDQRQLGGRWGGESENEGGWVGGWVRVRVRACVSDGDDSITIIMDAEAPFE